MSIAHLGITDEVYCGGQRIGRIYAGGAIAYQRREKIADFYGTSLGQLPLHLRPEDAVVDANGYVVSVPNKGGAGALFDATGKSGIAQTGPSVTQRTARGFINTGAHGGLLLANPAEAIGTRMFFVAQLDSEPTISNFAGYSGPDTAADGGRVSFLWANNNTPRLQIDRWNGAGNTSESAVRGLALGTVAWHLIEIEVTTAMGLRFWVDATPHAGDGAITYTTLPVQRLMWGYLANPFIGAARDICSMVTDGSAAMDTQAARIRKIIADKHGITLA